LCFIHRDVLDLAPSPQFGQDNRAVEHMVLTGTCPARRTVSSHEIAAAPAPSASPGTRHLNRYTVNWGPLVVTRLAYAGALVNIGQVDNLPAFLTRDDGHSWVKVSPCQSTGMGGPVSVATLGDKDIWALCSGGASAGSTREAVTASTDGGAQWDLVAKDRYLTEVPNPSRTKTAGCWRPAGPAYGYSRRTASTSVATEVGPGPLRGAGRGAKARSTTLSFTSSTPGLVGCSNREGAFGVRRRASTGR
jgi:hypothetical protein